MTDQPEKELADFHPGTGHLHGCARTAFGSYAVCDADCANHLYAVAQDLERQGNLMKQVILARGDQDD